MSVALEIEVDGRPLERVEADLAVAGLFTDDRPLRGGVGRADWRLCGLISDLIRAGRLRGESGEALLLPSAGRLRAPRILLLGLGERAGFDVAASRDAMCDAVSRGLALGVHRLVVAPLGIAMDDFPRHAQAVLGGALEAVRERSATLDLRLAVRGSEAERSTLALEAAVRAGEASGVRLRRAQRGATRQPSNPRGRAAMTRQL